MNQMQSRRARYGSNAVVSVLIVVGLLAVVNLLAIEYQARYDTTEAGLYTLSDQSVTLLENATRDIQVISFFREQERKTLEPLLRQYAYRADGFSYRIVDPDREPVLARSYGVKNYGASIVQVADRQEVVVGTEEKAFTNAIAKALQEEQKVVYFLTGHRERATANEARDGFSRVKEMLQDANYTVRDSLFLVNESRVPEDCDLLVVAGPRSPFYTAELESIRDYLEGGKSAALFMVDPGAPTGIERLLLEWSVALGDDIVVEEASAGKIFGTGVTTPGVVRYADHPVTEKHHGLMTVFPIAQSLRQRGNLPGVDFTPLATTSAAAWGERNADELGVGRRPAFDPASDHRGPLIVSGALEGELNIRLREKGDHSNRKARIIVFGDSDFATNRWYPVQGNGDLFMNAVSWLLDEGQLISIRPKVRGYRPISLTQSEGEWIKWLSLIFVPGVPVVLGLLVWWRRR